MRATSTRPHAAGPFPVSIPVFTPAIVTVRSARMQTDAEPSSAFKPEGMSIASTGAPEPLTKRIQLANGSRTSPRIPVPSRPSITTACSLRSSG